MRGHLRKTKLLAFTVFAGSLLLAACGQKGPLYLPDKEPEAAEKKAESAAATTERQEGSAETADKQEKSGETAK